MIAAGEKWPDGSLRPALEDALGAGAVVTSLASELSRGAESIRATHRECDDVADAVWRSASGVQLTSLGFATDVEIATELDRSEIVPVLVDGAFVAEGG